jgi:Xaa-Pro aminopeptidase
MFESIVYEKRRAHLKEIMAKGIALFMGNTESSVNYPANTYKFRQDSDFLYFFGIDLPGLAAIIDFDSGEEWIFGDDPGLDDIVWTGPQPSVKELAYKCGVKLTAPVSKFEKKIKEALTGKRTLHFLPPYRGETKIALAALLNKAPARIGYLTSSDLIQTVISMRSIKEQIEINEIEKAIDIAWDMHVTAMKMCKTGVKEQDISGTIEGIALSRGAGTSFPVILTVNGQTLHIHAHDNILVKGKMMVVDCGAESEMRYASDITRTTPVDGRFGQRQKDIYEIVLKANTEAISAVKPGLSNLDIHYAACRTIAGGLKDLGLLKGDVNDAVAEGAHALFMPHGIGHMMGLDVHDMEGLGENFVGYNDKIKRSNQFGLSFLRFAIPYKPGHVFTIEPGCYFIPELIGKWKAEKKHSEFINYQKAESYLGFGGIRIEDNLLMTEKGYRVLGRPIPKTVSEIESVCS